MQLFILRTREINFHIIELLEHIICIQLSYWTLISVIIVTSVQLKP